MKTLAAVVGLMLILQGEQAVRVDVNLKEIAVTVRDQAGNGIAGLQASDFVLEEDGVPQDIAHVAVVESPVSFGILIDNRRKNPGDNNTDSHIESVTGLNPAFPAGVAAAIELAARKRPSDRISLMTFSASLKIETDFTANGEEIQNRVRQIRQSEQAQPWSNREMSTFSAIDAAFGNMRKASTKRVLVVFSAWSKEAGSRPAGCRMPCDAELEQSNKDSLKKGIEETQIVIYGFGVEAAGVSSMGFGRSTLGQLFAFAASGSGGLSQIYGMITPGEQGDLALDFVRTLLSIESNRNKEYVIGYYPKNPDSKAKRVTRVRTVSANRVDRVTIR